MYIFFFWLETLDERWFLIATASALTISISYWFSILLTFCRFFWCSSFIRGDSFASIEAVNSSLVIGFILNETGYWWSSLSESRVCFAFISRNLATLSANYELATAPDVMLEDLACSFLALLSMLEDPPLPWVIFLDFELIWPLWTCISPTMSLFSCNF